MNAHTVRACNQKQYHCWLPKLFLLSAVIGIPITGFAQKQPAKIDSGHSYARLFVGSEADPYSFSPGVARVSGYIIMDAKNPTNTSLEFTLFAAGEIAKNLGNQDIAHSIAIDFRSQRTVLGDNQCVIVAGELVVTETTRTTISADANEAYAGPIYGDPVTKTLKRNVSFVLPVTELNAKGRTDISATSAIAHESFPDLLPALMNANWPLLVQDKHCEPPNTIGEDYSGGHCSGTIVETANRILPSRSIGEDYYGVSVIPPDGSEVTIQLQLAAVAQGGSQEELGE